MKTTTPINESNAISILTALRQEEMMQESGEYSIEVPLQKMFDEFMVFISKANLE